MAGLWIGCQTQTSMGYRFPWHKEIYFFFLFLVLVCFPPSLSIIKSFKKPFSCYFQVGRAGTILILNVTFPMSTRYCFNIYVSCWLSYVYEISYILNKDNINSILGRSVSLCYRAQLCVLELFLYPSSYTSSFPSFILHGVVWCFLNIVFKVLLKEGGERLRGLGHASISLQSCNCFACFITYRNIGKF